MKPCHSFFPSLALLSGLVLSGPSFAAGLAPSSESFAGKTAGFSRFQAPTVKLSEAGLSYPGYESAGKALQKAAGDALVLSASLPQQGEAFLSFLVEADAAGKLPTVALFEGLDYRFAVGPEGNRYGLRGPDGTALLASAPAAGKTHLIVLRLGLETGLVSLYLNPASASTLPPKADATLNLGAGSRFSDIVLNTESCAEGSCRLDEVRLTSSYTALFRPSAFAAFAETHAVTTSPGEAELAALDQGTLKPKAAVSLGRLLPFAPSVLGGNTVTSASQAAPAVQAPTSRPLAKSAALPLNPAAPADITVTNELAAANVEPLGANLGVIAGGTNFFSNNLIPYGGFEPANFRLFRRVERMGTNWMEWDVFGGVSNFQLDWTGLLNGAKIRFYRLTDAQGAVVPEKDGYLDLSKVAQAKFVGEAQVPTPNAQFPLGGWIANKWVNPGQMGLVQGSLKVSDASSITDGKTYYYVVKAVDVNGNESVASNEVSATPQTSQNPGPRLVFDYRQNEKVSIPEVKVGEPLKSGWAEGYLLNVKGGTAPYTFRISEGTLPAGLSLDAAKGALTGTVTALPANAKFTVEVKDAAGKIDTRAFVINPTVPAKDANDKTAPAAPTGLTAVAQGGMVNLSWQASSSTETVGYKIYRSDVPGSQQQERVYFTSTGAPITLAKWDYAYITLKTNYFPRETRPATVDKFYGGTGGLRADDKFVDQRRVPHPGTLPADFKEPGEACLYVNAHTAPWAGNWNVTLGGNATWHKYGFMGEGYWYNQLKPGAKYRAEVWARQEGLGNGGKVRYTMNGEYNVASQPEDQAWTVTGEWKKYTYDFTGPAYPNNDGHMFPELKFTAPGKLWIDNWTVYRNDEKHEFKPFTPHEVSLDEMMDSSPGKGRKGVARLYGLTFNHADLMSQFGNWPSSDYEISWTTHFSTPSATLHQGMEWVYKTGDSPYTRMVPMLTQPNDYTEKEWMALVEWLGSPYDPAKDSPTLKPYAHKRWQMRGHGRPWTDDFREILIEFGNESWHNGAMAAWDGFGRPNWVWAGGKEYGIFGKYFINENIAKMPEWNALGLGKKIKFMFNGSYDADPNSSIGELAIRQGSMASFVTHANYTGPKWETGDGAVSKTFNDVGLQEYIMGSYTGGANRNLADWIFRTRDSLRIKENVLYDVMAYEGGPGGYWMNRDNEVVDEHYSKSLAAGNATLDTWMYCSYKGFKHQGYLGMGSGKWWSSHSFPEMGGYRPFPGWMALKLRNKHVQGPHMFKNTVTSVPTLKRGNDTIPLLSSHTFRDTSVYSVLLLNHKVDKVNYQGQNLGDGYTPVTLRLPFTAAKKITVHKMTAPDGSPADPRWNNLHESQVVITSKDVPVSAFSKDFKVDAARGATDKGLPPAGVYLYVFEGVTGAPALPTGIPVVSVKKGAKKTALNAAAILKAAQVGAEAGKKKP